MSEFNLTESSLRDLFLKNFKTFRNYEDWLCFNNEYIALTYGTRFHVNMASILSGVPALWITHDDRTREMTKFFNLPAISLLEAQKIRQSDLIQIADYANFKSNLESIFDQFNNYLKAHQLPLIKY
jgi:hypothetical protein